MTEPPVLMSTARRILDGAGRDLDRGWRESACVSAQRAAVLATQAWLEDRGQVHVSASVRENVALEPDTPAGILEAATLLDRYRIDEGEPYAAAAEIDPVVAARVVEAGRSVVAFAEKRLGG
ncbi:MAG: HEPN domain-containing protein [Gemmatimonadota bacterium]|nr:HEPN domain-containing protein [Gemmatimonadota bacterium]